MVRIDQDGNEMPIPLDQVPMKGSVSMTLFPRDSQDVQEDSVVVVGVMVAAGGGAKDV